ncbi:MAG: Sulfite exporter TauE/SafE, partial [Actinobacteria bacterium]|nr:Sulfite exporter TauE/SafE [Actinomycetota bacterium]
MELTLTTGILIAAVSFAAEYVDSSLGMGYGTTLTPVLLLMGFAPLEVVPALLVSQLLAGLLSGFVHHSMGNVNLKPLTLSPSVVWRNVRRFGVRESFRRGLPRGLQVALVITVASVVGTVAAVLLAVNLPEKVLRLYVAALVLAIGIVILVTIKLHLAFSWKRIVGLGMLAAFNNGLSGGGYGPLVTGGQVLSGVPVRETVGITAVAEAFTCLVGIVAYAFQPEAVWRLAPYLAAGAL